MNKDIIRRHNQLIQLTSFDLLYSEYRLVLLAIALLPLEAETFDRPLEISVKTIADAFGIAPSSLKKFYSTVKNLVTSLSKSTLHIHKNQDILQFPWFDSIEYIYNKAIVEVVFYKRLEPFLLKLTREFTCVNLEQIMNLSTFSTIRLYELCKSRAFLTHSTFYNIDELRRILGATANKYTEYSKLKQRILNKAIDEINKNTDLFISVNELKRGRTTTGVFIEISKNKEITIPLEVEDDDSLCEKIIFEWNLKMTRSPASKLYGKDKARLLKIINEDEFFRENWSEMIAAVAAHSSWNGFGPRGMTGNAWHASFQWMLENLAKVKDETLSLRAKKERKKTRENRIILSPHPDQQEDEEPIIFEWWNNLDSETQKNIKFKANDLIRNRWESPHGGLSLLAQGYLSEIHETTLLSF